MRRILAICAIAALAAVACIGCGSSDISNDGGATKVTPNEEQTTPTEEVKQVNEAALSPSATPAPTDTPTPAPTATPAVDENGMMLLCPSQYLKKRDGAAYGKFNHITYYSDYCKRDRGATVLLPAGYTEEKKYPVVYLLHGIFGDENSFAGDANLPVLIGNLVADGLSEEFILVCPAMFAASDDTAQAPGFSAEQMIPYDNFAHDLTQCLIPYIEENYSVIGGREGTYIAGFSMGGRETLYTIITYPDRFRAACAIAPAPGLVPGVDMFMTHEGSYKEEEVKFADGVTIPDKIIICCGTKDSVVGQFPKSYHNLFVKNGIDHIWYEVPNADHDMNAQYSGLYNFLQFIGK